ncbi:alpha-N-acetylgalactosaminide alpha-2,6-sialyltransferase 1-like [Ascaphus truei]|uniref:alpha-N-acetylgalactosaminide alpha-2,6-sialyltransferase 1-like n=1 Tax=Ascaphus truei TaxID=8439 RepID=UPI003F59569A
MRFSRLKWYLCLSAVNIAILVLLHFFRHPKEVQLYPRRQTDDVRSIAMGPGLQGLSGAHISPTRGEEGESEQGTGDTEPTVKSPEKRHPDTPTRPGVWNVTPRKVSSAQVFSRTSTSGNAAPRKVTSANIHPKTTTSGNAELRKVTPPNIHPKSTTSVNAGLRKVTPPNTHPKTTTSGNAELRKVTPPNIHPKTTTSGNAALRKVTSPNIHPQTTTSVNAELRKVTPPNTHPKSTTSGNAELRKVTSPNIHPKSTTSGNAELRKVTSANIHPKSTTSGNAELRKVTSANNHPKTTTSRNVSLRNVTSTHLHAKMTTSRNSHTTTLNGHRFPATSRRKPLRALDFTAEPKWDFEENYTLETASGQTTCPVSVKIKAANSSWLKESFLLHVTIFMDKSHFSVPEWHRLGHFLPPYGWMELNYTVVQEVVSALPRLSDQQILLSASSSKTPHCVSCAVVGNGGILNASRLGKEIDSHDYVFRVNGAVIKGFEDDVGTRTSYYGFTAYTMLNSIYLLKEQGFTRIPRDKETKYILFPEAKRDYEWLKALQQNTEIAKGNLDFYSIRPREVFGNSFDLKKLLVTHPDFMRYLKNRFLRSDTLDGHYWDLYRPSTGALVLLTAFHLCDKVSAYGFMTGDYENYSNHYYDKTNIPIVFHVNHDFLLERDLWARLHKANIINLYQRT